MMNPIKLYLLHFDNINKFYDSIVDKKKELASRIPGCATLDNKFLLNGLWWIAVIIEPFLSIFLIILLFPYYLYKIVKRSKPSQVGDHIALCYAGLAKQRIKAVSEIYNTIDYCLYPVGVDENWEIEGKERHDILEIVSLWDVIRALFWSILAVFFATIKTHGRYLYRNYLCFEYLLTYYFFQKIKDDCTIYFVNHLDRWAVLFNLLPQKNKILIQHGIEAPDANWPVKLTNVNKAYVFAESQKSRLEKAVLGKCINFVIMPPTIKLTDMNSGLDKNIVIVAGENYKYFEQEEYIISHLPTASLKIYIKIHPGKNDYQKYINLQRTKNSNIEVIVTQTFPNVNAVISHYSTLGLEYEAYHIPVLYYDEMSLDEIVDKISNL